MGRLFWKFFFFLWLAQFISALGVGVGIWSLRHHDRGPGVPPQVSGPQQFAPRPPPDEAFRPGQPPGPPPDARGPRPPDDGWDLMRPIVPFLPPPGPIIVGSAVSLLFAALLAWYFSRPIRTLRDAFEAIAAGRLETRVGAAMGGRRDELVDLGRDFDRMADRLGLLLDSQRRLLHDVSHEMRSPLARLQAAVGLMRQQPERIEEFMERLERDTRRMDRLVGELLTLARIDAGSVPRPTEPVDVAALLADIVGDASVEASAANCRLELGASAARLPNIPGNAELLHRALENVIRNAIAHSPAGAVVSIDAGAAGDMLVVRVRDAGAGVPEHVLDDIFRPFFRSASSAAFSGFGLGLAITRSVAEFHGGSVRAANHPQGGLEIALQLPLAAK